MHLSLRPLLPLWAICLGNLFPLAFAAAQEPTKEKPSTTTSPVATDSVVNANPQRLRVGDVAPDFELPGIGDQVVKLSDYREGSDRKTAHPKNVVIVFVRAHW